MGCTACPVSWARRYNRTRVLHAMARWVALGESATEETDPKVGGRVSFRAKDGACERGMEAPSGFFSIFSVY